jgi:hypothetical protein
MFEGLKHSFHLHRLQRKKRGIESLYDADISRARAENKDKDEIDILISERFLFLDEVDDEIITAHSRYFVEEAQNLLVPVPEFKTIDGEWEESRIDGRWRLTKHALADLRSAVRREKKERREHWQAWLASVSSAIGMVIGLVGVTIALLSFLEK